MTKQEAPKRKFGGPQPGSGRPPKPKSEHMVYIQITLPPDMRTFAKNQPGGASAYIRRLIEDDRKRLKVDENSSK